jgi:hypothetical protein
MNSNNHPSAYGYQPDKNNGHKAPGHPAIEMTLRTNALVIERKNFLIALKENRIGRFLRIIEQGGTKQSAIIIPAAGLENFQKMLAEMVATAASAPPKSGPEKTS